MKYPIAKQDTDGTYVVMPNLPEAEYHVLMDVPYTRVCLTCQTPLSELECCLCNLPDRELALISEKVVWPDEGNTITLTPCPCCGQPLDPSISSMLQCGCSIHDGMCLTHEKFLG